MWVCENTESNENSSSKIEEVPAGRRSTTIAKKIDNQTILTTLQLSFSPFPILS